jgi:hypothetical protein
VDCAVKRGIKSGRIVPAGHNVFLYRVGARLGVTVEIGVEVTAPCQSVGGVEYSRTPSGDVVSTVHRGANSGLGAAHDALVGWCSRSRLARAGVWWEAYGDWQEDPEQVETQVFHLLRTGSDVRGRRARR